MLNTYPCRAATLNRQDTLLGRPLHGVVTDEEIEALAERNAMRVLQAIEALGPRYTCHQPLRKET